MAHVFSRKRKNGLTWYVGYYVDGNIIQKRVGSSKNLAQKVAGEIEAKLERKEAGLAPKDYKISKFFKEYQEFNEGKVSPSYSHRNQRVINNFLEYLEKKHKRMTKLSQITLRMVESYMSYRLKAKVPNSGAPIKKRTVNIELGTLKTMFNRAVKWGYLAENPLTYIDYLKEDDSKKIRSLTVEEVQKALAASPAWFYPILFTLLHTGMREGEIINLEWDDVDFKNGVIKIHNKEFWKPKSSGKDIRERDIIMTDELITFLKRHKLANKRKFEDSFVFHNRAGKKVPPRLRKVIASVTKKCGFPEVTQIHAIRHTYITHLIKCSKDIAVAQAQAGHADIRTTMKYADMLQEHRKIMANTLDYGNSKASGKKGSGKLLSLG